MLASVLGTIVTVYGLIAGGSSLLQARRMARRGTSEDVSLSFLGMYVAGYALWLVYGLTTGSLPLIIVDVAGLLSGTCTLVLAVYLHGPGDPGDSGIRTPEKTPEIASESLGELISRSATAERYDQAALAGVPMPEATWEATQNTAIFIVGLYEFGVDYAAGGLPVSLLDATIDRAKAQIGEGRATAGVRLAAAGPRSRPPR